MVHQLVEKIHKKENQHPQRRSLPVPSKLKKKEKRSSLRNTKVQLYKEVSSGESSSEDEIDSTPKVDSAPKVIEPKSFRPRKKVPAVVVQTLNNLIDSVVSIAEKAKISPSKVIVEVKIVPDESSGKILDHTCMDTATEGTLDLSSKRSSKKRSRSPSLESKIQENDDVNTPLNGKFSSSKRPRSDLRQQPLREKRLSVSPKTSPRKGRQPASDKRLNNRGSTQVVVSSYDISVTGEQSKSEETEKLSVKLNLELDANGKGAINKDRRGSLRRSRSISQDSRPPFPLEVKSAALERLLGGETQTAVAQDLNINPSTLAHWWAKRDAILSKVRDKRVTKIEEIPSNCVHLDVSMEQKCVVLKSSHEEQSVVGEKPLESLDGSERNLQEIYEENIRVAEKSQALILEESLSADKLKNHALPDLSENVEKEQVRLTDETQDHVVIEKDIKENSQIRGYLEIVPASASPSEEDEKPRPRLNSVGSPLLFSSPSKCNRTQLAVKKDAIQKIQAGDSQVRVATLLEVPISTVSNLLRNKDTILTVSEPLVENGDAIEDTSVEELGLIEKANSEPKKLAESEVPAFDIVNSKEILLKSMKSVFSGIKDPCLDKTVEEQDVIEKKRDKVPQSAVIDSDQENNTAIVENSDLSPKLQPVKVKQNISSKKKSLEFLTSTLMKKALGQAFVKEENREKCPGSSVTSAAPPSGLGLIADSYLSSEEES